MHNTCSLSHVWYSTSATQNIVYALCGTSRVPYMWQTACVVHLWSVYALCGTSRVPYMWQTACVVHPMVVYALCGTSRYHTCESLKVGALLLALVVFISLLFIDYCSFFFCIQDFNESTKELDTIIASSLKQLESAKAFYQQMQARVKRDNTW